MSARFFDLRDDGAPDRPIGRASERLAVPDGEGVLYRRAFTPAERAHLFAVLREETAWRQQVITVYGRAIASPRLSAWHGDPEAVYGYSGLRLEPAPWTPTLRIVRERVEALAATRFNSVLLNLYRDGQDSMGWHSDDEPELGTNPVIASVSLGATRTFQFKHKQNPDLKLSLDLTHGSLLLMRGGTQHFWKHQVPKTKKPLGPRINLTFRVII